MSVYVGLKQGKVHEKREMSEYYCGACGWPVTDHDSYCRECSGELHEGMADLIANVDESIHDFVKAMDKLQERCEALESLVRDMHDLLATPAWDRGGWTTDGRCVDFDTRMAELGLKVSE